MELGVRDWMIVVGVLLIFVVLLDGYRRVRNERRDNIRVKLNKNFLNSELEEEEALTNSELPSGPRVVGRSVRKQEFDDREDEAPIVDESEDVPVETVEAQPVAELDELESFRADMPDVLEQGTEQAAASAADKVDPAKQEVIMVNVMARDGAKFKGADLTHILLHCGLRHGDMQFFHRHEDSIGQGAVQFSVANIINPGTFDVDNIDAVETPGVSFFICVPGPKDPVKAFDYMVETAKVVAKNLDGELLDDTRSAMTKQTLEHHRQRIVDIERRRLAQHV